MTSRIVLLVKTQIHNSMNTADKTGGKLCEILRIHVVSFERKDMC